MEADNNKVLELKGLNYIFLNGRLLLGPSGFKPILITGLFIFIPFVLFLTFNSQFFHFNLNIVISVIAILLLIVTVYYMILTAMKDPGIIPRSTRTLTSDQTKFKAKINQMGYLTQYKRCETCFIVRPLRSHHCADCDNCVERFDHHCPWLSNCVGKRNYRDFYMFVILLNILTIYMIAFSVVHIVVYLRVHINLFDALADFDNNAAAALNQVIVALFIVIYGLITMIFTTGLFVYHTNLIAKNMTTNEELKSYFRRPIGNPYVRNVSTNCKQALCAIQSEPSLMDEIRMKNKEKERRRNTYLDEEQNRLNKIDEYKKEQYVTKTDHQEVNVEVLDRNSHPDKKEIDARSNHRNVETSRLGENNVYVDKSIQNKGSLNTINAVPDLDDEKINYVINNFRSEDDSDKSSKSQRKREFHSNQLNEPEVAATNNDISQTKFKLIKGMRNNHSKAKIHIDDATNSYSKDEARNQVINNEEINLQIPKDIKK